RIQPQAQRDGATGTNDARSRAGERGGGKRRQHSVNGRRLTPSDLETPPLPFPSAGSSRRGGAARRRRHSGTLGYMLIERWNAWDAFYMTIITTTTVG